MGSVTIAISQSILEWVLDQISNDNTIKQSVIDKVREWKEGGRPTFNQIKEVSGSTHIPFGYFFLKNPPNEINPILEYRTVNSIKRHNPSRDALDVIYAMENIQNFIKDYRFREGFEKLSFVGCAGNEKSPEKILSLIRTSLGICQDWYKASDSTGKSFNIIKNILMENGISVMQNGIVGGNTHRVLDIKEFRAFTLADPAAPLIFINTNDSKSGKLFSLLHELCHLYMGESSFYNDYPESNFQVFDTETICNKVAVEILAPKEMFVALWNEDALKMEENEKIENIAGKFKCGKVIIARRALDCDFISRDMYLEVVKEAEEKYFKNRNKKRSGGDYYNVLAAKYDKNFLRSLYYSVKEGRTSYTEAFRLTGTSLKTFEKLMEKAGGGAW